MSKKSKRKNGQKRAKKVFERKQRLLEEKRIEEAKIHLVKLPYIGGADFESERNNITEYESKISVGTSDRKRRILFISEATYLSTGFSTYTREVLTRLHKTGKYELAEFGSYGYSTKLEPRTRNIPWKYYHNMPETSLEAQEYGDPNGSKEMQEKYSENQFGKWRLDYVLADFRPDIVICIRDNWMDTHVLKSRFRGNFKMFWMPTVDGYPQKWEWLSDYSKVDKLFTYSWYGKKVLESQSTSLIAKHIQIPELKVNNVIQPGVDLDIFKPMDKAYVRKLFGNMPNNIRFIGTVMRNQPRKLFTRIIESFRIFKERYPIESKDAYLLLHTSIPDVGWDIPECVRQNGLYDWTIYSYLCLKCNQIIVSRFVGSPTDCTMCGGKGCMQTPNTQYAFNNNQFPLIFNLMDLYVQASIAEGDGMPPNEAKACGVPCLLSDWSALYEKARNGGAIPIKNLTESETLPSFTEHQTMQHRSLIDRKDLVRNFVKLFGNESKRKSLSLEARECAVKYYGWDLCAKKWEYEIDKIKLLDSKETWEKTIELRVITEESPPENISDEEFLRWCYKNLISGKEPDEGGLSYWTQFINKAPDKKAVRKGLEKHFRKLVEDENKAKKLLQDPKNLITNPIDRIRKLVEEAESEAEKAEQTKEEIINE